MYAIVEIGGKQHKVGLGQELLVEKLGQTSGAITFDKVLFLGGSGETKVGTPYVPGFTVVAEVLGEEKGDKIHIRKFKAKSRYRRHTGFRAKLTRIKVEAIGGNRINKFVSGEIKTEKVAAKAKAIKTPKKASKK